MKNFIIELKVILLLGILTVSTMSFMPSNIASASTIYTWYGGAQSNDSSALPNVGVRSVIDVINQPIASGSLSVWVSEELANGIWIQAGYVVNQYNPVPHG